MEPPPTTWALPDPALAPRDTDLLGVGADLRPGTVLAAYRLGLFPMPVHRRGPVGWWSPDPRGVIPLPGLRVSRSLRRAVPRFHITYDTAFEQVVRACGDPHRPHGWITPAIRRCYVGLHELGWAHSVEVRAADGALVGGLYGLQLGGLFAGESMFHTSTDASKVALVALVQRLSAAGAPARRLLDVQWATRHLASLGAVEVPRSAYLRALAEALPLPPARF